MEFQKEIDLLKEEANLVDQANQSNLGSAGSTYWELRVHNHLFFLRYKVYLFNLICEIGRALPAFTIASLKLIQKNFYVLLLLSIVLLIICFAP